MAGSRPSQFKKGGGGGRLNGVDGTIVGYEFTDVFPFGDPDENKARNAKSKYGAKMLGNLKVRIDGADEDTIEPLSVGNAENFADVTDDGHTLVPSDDDFELSMNSKWSKFISSLCNPTNGKRGFDDTLLPEDRINYEAIIGARCRFVRVKDEELQAKFGPKVSKKKNPKTGKPYENDRDYLAVEAFYGMEDMAPAKTTKGSTAAKSTTTKAAGGKPNGRAVEVDETDRNYEALLMLVEKFGASFSKDKLKGAPAQMALKKAYGADADAVRRAIYSDAFLEAAVEAEVISGFEDNTITAA